MESKCVSRETKMNIVKKEFWTGLWAKVQNTNFSELKNKIKIPESWTKADTWATLARRLIYIVCFAWLCQIDQIIGSANYGEQFINRNYTGLIIGIIILTAYKVKDFIKIPYLVWTVLFFVGRYFALRWAPGNVDIVEQFEASLWSVLIYGVIFIRMFYLYVIEKVKPQMNWIFFGIWVAMMVGMVVSVNDDTWYLWFFLMFGTFYLTNYTQKQLNTLFTAMAEGIILAFIYFQWQACLHRPYDTIRYTGYYENCNMNALFYVVAYLAVLAKWYMMKLKQRILILRLPIIALAGALWALTTFTMCRTALIAMGVFTLLFFVFQIISKRRRRILEFIVDCSMLVLSIVLLFEPTYNLVRYVPAYTNDPIYFAWEDTSKKIQKDEAFDSEKYVEYEEMVEFALKRVIGVEKIEAGSIWNKLFPRLEVSASEHAELDYEMMVPIEWRGFSSEFPMIVDPKDKDSSVKHREAIYDFYWRNMNFEGHTMEENGVWVTKTYKAPHGHNILLQVAYDHGWIVGALFAASILITIIWGIRGSIKCRSGAYYYRLFVMAGSIVIFMSFGMFEICWRFGHISLVLLFMAFRLMCHRDETKVMKKVKLEEQSEEES